MFDNDIDTYDAHCRGQSENPRARGLHIEHKTYGVCH